MHEYLTTMTWLLIAWLALLAVLALVVRYECAQADKEAQEREPRSPWPH